MEDERADARYLTHRQLPVGEHRVPQRNVSYPGDERVVLSNLNLTIAPGERVGIIGRVGSGKTTFGRLLCRLYDATRGEVLVDKIDVKQYHPYEIRHKFVFIGHDAEIFRAHCVLTCCWEKWMQAMNSSWKRCARLGLTTLSPRIPWVSKCLSGEKGHGLSSGERQLICLARAYLKDAQLMFLDDPTSALDQNSESVFVKRLSEMVAAGKTLVVATHRTAVLGILDRLIVLENGKVVLDGPKKDVLCSWVGNPRIVNTGAVKARKQCLPDTRDMIVATICGILAF